MIKMSIEQIYQKLTEQLQQNSIVKIIDRADTNSKITLTLDSINSFYLEIDEYGIALLYCDERDEFFIDPYKNEKEFFSDITRQIEIMFKNIIRIEHVYSKNSLLSYRVLAINKNSKHRTLLKKVTVSFNPILWLMPKHTTIKEICFKSIIQKICTKF